MPLLRLSKPVGASDSCERAAIVAVRPAATTTARIGCLIIGLLVSSFLQVWRAPVGAGCMLAHGFWSHVASPSGDLGKAREWHLDSWLRREPSHGLGVRASGWTLAGLVSSALAA